MSQPPNPPTQFFDQEGTIDTPLGRINVMCEVGVEGDTLHLRNLLIYSEHGEPIQGAHAQLLAFRSMLMQLARDAGYNYLRISGHRTAQSSSANPGKTIDVTIRLY